MVRNALPVGAAGAQEVRAGDLRHTHAGERTGVSKADGGSRGRAGWPQGARGARTFVEDPPPRPPALPASAEAVPRRRGG